MLGLSGLRRTESVFKRSMTTTVYGAVEKAVKTTLVFKTAEILSATHTSVESNAV